ncbi:MAG: hypothetical protein C4320_06725 [Armatimonadota bacterium]
MLPSPSPEERARRLEVVARICDFTERGERILLPPFNAESDCTDDRSALVSVGIEPNDFSGTLGPYRYQFEGEEDLLHMIVTAGGAPVTVEEGQAVCGFVLAGVAPAVIWLRPGERSQHFYVGHDEVLAHATR